MEENKENDIETMLKEIKKKNIKHILLLQEMINIIDETEEEQNKILKLGDDGETEGTDILNLFIEQNNEDDFEKVGLKTLTDIKDFELKELWTRIVDTIKRLNNAFNEGLKEGKIL